jgi:DNA-binding transcriptional ArsR family regulator
MLVIAYTKNDQLLEKMHMLEGLRRDIHAFPVGRKALHATQWNAVLSRIEGALSHEGMIVDQSTIYRILNSGKPQNEKSQKVLRYKSSLDYIRNDWYVTHEKISPHAVATLDALVTGNVKGTLSNRTPVQRLYDIKQLLSYLESGDEHPIIQAGIAHVEIVQRELVPENSPHLATLIAYMFLYKHGWDLRELLVLEKAWMESKIDYNYSMSATKQNNNATQWLEYFVEMLVSQAQSILESLSSIESSTKDIGVHSSLLPRHLEIIAQLDDPQARITNKDVKEKFGISQITASRDLAMLTMMGLLFSHGKGRSTYYTKV